MSLITEYPDWIDENMLKNLSDTSQNSRKLTVNSDEKTTLSAHELCTASKIWLG